MEKCLAFIVLLLSTFPVFSQILLEDKQGDQIANNAPLYTNHGSALPLGINTSMIKLNTGDQSLGFNYIVSSKNHNPSNYKIHEFGVKAKSTGEFGAIFSSGQLSPGIRVTYSLTKVPVFRNVSKYIDWGGINVSYDINRYSLFKRDTNFNNQFFSETAQALSIHLNYNALINSIWIVNARIGYSRRNNYDYLSSVDLEDISTIVDPSGALVRQVIRKRSAKEGQFINYDGYPMVLAITRAAPTDPPTSPAAAKLRFGYTLYFKNMASNLGKPETNTGLIFFLTKQDKAGIRSPVFGLNIEAQDPFDIRDAKNGLHQRLEIGFTTIFTL